MAKIKKDTKQKSKKTVLVDETVVTGASETPSPSSVEAAYWQEKAESTITTSKKTKSGETKQVDEYTSNIMVMAKPNESSEQLLRRFNREVRDINLIDEIRERLEYEKPSQRRKREKRERVVNSRRRRSWNE